MLIAQPYCAINWYHDDARDANVAARSIEIASSTQCEASISKPEAAKDNRSAIYLEKFKGELFDPNTWQRAR